MRPSLLLQSIAALATLTAIGLVTTNPGCREIAQVREAADRLIEQGKQAGLTGQHPAAPAITQVILPRSQSAIIIGTMNIRTFGVAKVQDPQVMPTLVQIARQFDCLAIQEIRSKHDQTILKQFVQMINADGARYDYFLSPLLGDTSQTFQYGVIFDTNRIEPTGSAFVVPDPYNLLHREPLVTGLRTRTNPPSRAFSFALVNVHIDPDKTRAELDVLYEVYHWLRAALPGEDDIIVLGDFNEPPHRYGNLWQIPTLRAAIPDGVATNTLQNAAYDNILFDGDLTREYTGKSGVIDMQQAFGLTLEQAQAVSDHQPVWAEFTAGEITAPQYATQPGPIGR